MFESANSETNPISTKKTTCWHHSPLHCYEANRAYMITSGTLNKQHIFRGDVRLGLLQETLLTVLCDYHWLPQAWAIFSNHYHCVVLSPEDGHGKVLKALVQRIHSETARKVNLLDETPGRRVWFQYRDTVLTYEKSYYARLNYTHNNAVKHGMVLESTQYPYCSASWFEQMAARAFYNKITSFKWDMVNVDDDYEARWR